MVVLSGEVNLVGPDGRDWPPHAKWDLLANRTDLRTRHLLNDRAEWVQTVGVSSYRLVDHDEWTEGTVI